MTTESVNSSKHLKKQYTKKYYLIFIILRQVAFVKPTLTLKLVIV